MKQLIILLIFALILFGCQDVAKPEKPKDLIGKDKMVDILMETYLINASRSVNNRAIIDKGIKIDSLIYKKFEIDSVQFVESNAYYATDVNVYMEMIQKVETRLTLMQKEMDSLSEKERDRKDSISEISKEPKTNIE